MATIRRAGFGSIFEVENETVGIGTTGTATNTLQVLGDIKSSDATVIGLSTLTTYQGFVDKEARFGKAVIDVESQAGTLGEVTIEGDVTVSSASTLTSSVNQLTLTDSFSVPTGNTDSRIHCHTAGSMRFNEDLGTLEFYTGDMWKTVNSFKDTGNRGRAVWAGGYDNSGTPHHHTRSIDFINVPTLGNSISFGELSAQGQDAHGCGSETRGIYMGEFNSDAIEYITIASEGDSIDFGDMTASRNYGASGSSSTRGLHLGGDSGGTGVNTIDYIQINTLGDALDFGDLTVARLSYGGALSNGRTISVGGGTPSNRRSTYDQITIAAKGNAVEFGELTNFYNYGPGGNSNQVRGVLAGGQNFNPSYSIQIQHITLSSGGNAQYFGDLMHTSLPSGAGVTAVRAVFAIGLTNTPSTADVNTLEYISIASTGNSQDFGDLRGGNNRTFTRVISPVSDSHGGLGGF